VDVDGLVAGKSLFGDRRSPPFPLVHPFPDLCLLLSEQETEL
jgi:hypothetical protein